MASFQQNVLLVAIVIFVVLMIVIAVMMNSAQKNQAFPPQVGACPDYWQVLDDGTCQNVQGLGDNCKSPMDFSGEEYKGYDGAKKKCDFAKSCNIEWDGITNRSPALCS